MLASHKQSPGLHPLSHRKLGMGLHSCGPSTQVVEDDRWEFEGHPWLHNEFEASLGCVGPFSRRKREREKKNRDWGDGSVSKG